MKLLQIFSMITPARAICLLLSALFVFGFSGCAQRDDSQREYMRRLHEQTLEDANFSGNPTQSSNTNNDVKS